MITATIKVTLEPFDVPSNVQVNKIHGYAQNLPYVDLKDLSEDTIQGLCAAFVKGIYKKAQIDMPPTQAGENHRLSDTDERPK